MNGYSVFMFAFAVMLLLFAWLIYRGNRHLIRTFYAAKVKDKKAYCRFFGKSLAWLALVPAVSGLVALPGDINVMILPAMAVLIGGFILGIILIVRAQKKNGPL